MSKIHILIYGHEFPNPVEPVRGLFISRILEFYPEDIEIKVIAPVPWLLNWRRKKQDIIIPCRDEVLLKDRNIEVFRPRYILFPKNFFRPLVGWFEYTTSIKFVKLLQAKWRIDLIHVNFAHPDGISVNYISRKLKIPYVITEHHGIIGNLLQSRYLKAKILRVYRESAKTIVVSEFARQEIIKHGHKELSCVVIPNGVDINRFVLKPKKQKPVNLVFIGNLIYTKGIQLLIQALSMLKKQQSIFKLSVIGDGIYKDKLIKMTCKLGLPQDVVFLGTKKQTEIDEILPEQDILILPSFIESFSIVLIEAMAAGLPVIATRCGGPEYIVTEETGILVTPNSVSELAQAIVTMHNDWENYNPEIIRNYVRNKFDIVSVTKNIFSLYRELLKQD